MDIDDLIQNFRACSVDPTLGDLLSKDGGVPLTPEERRNFFHRVFGTHKLSEGYEHARTQPHDVFPAGRLSLLRASSQALDAAYASLTESWRNSRQKPGREDEAAFCAQQREGLLQASSAQYENGLRGRDLSAFVLDFLNERYASTPAVPSAPFGRLADAVRAAKEAAAYE